jgi:hypothetical protein
MSRSRFFHGPIIGSFTAIEALENLSLPEAESPDFAGYLGFRSRLTRILKGLDGISHCAP